MSRASGESARADGGSGRGAESAELGATVDRTADTRERILLAASRLFARQGYHGTSTREIARAVGVRQPSLFHHFASKAAIMQALIDLDLDEAVPEAERLAREAGSATVRLYRHLVHDVEHLVTSPYDLSGLYTDEVFGDPDFEPWRAKRLRLHRAIEEIVADGVRRGEFVEVAPEFVREAIVGIMLRTLSQYSGGRSAFDPSLGDRVGAFVLRAIVRRSSTLERARAEAGAAGPG